jgi:hypothetical protein
MMISHDCGKMIVMHMLSVMSFPVEKNKNDNKLVIHVNNRSPRWNYILFLIIVCELEG